MSPEEVFQKLLLDYQLESRGKAGGQLAEYYRLLCKWNAKINLTASCEWRALKPLFEEALWAAGRYPAEERTHMDIGSGAGFPALPMRIIRSAMRLEMVESRTKRALFLESVVRELDLRNVLVHNARIEKFLGGRGSQGGWHVISWKGLRFSTRQFSLLRGNTSCQTEFWIFHGKQLPVTDAGRALAGLTLLSKQQCPGSRGRYLSIYR